MKKKLELFTITALGAVALSTPLSAHAAESQNNVQFGIVNSEDGLNLREKPTETSRRTISLAYNSQVKILDKVDGTLQGKPHKWYKISYNNQVCYAVEDYITVVDKPSPSLPEANKPANTGQPTVEKEEVYTDTSNKNLSADYIENSYANFRSEPTTRSAIIGRVYENTKDIKVLGFVENKDGELWVKLSLNGKVGYVYNEFLDVGYSGTYTKDEAFEAKLEKESFPEEYKIKLRKLHSKHPNWVFKSIQIGTSFEDAVNRENGDENRSGINTVQKNGIYSQYVSKDPKDLNKDGTNKVYDSGEWVGASKEGIEYFMNPLNHLDGKGIYQFTSLRNDNSTYSQKQMENMVKNTFLEGRIPNGNRTYIDVIKEASEKSGVSPYMLASMILEEQGRSGYSGSISGTVKGYEGYYNFYNIGAYANSGRGAIENGLIYARSKGWTSQETSIIQGAKWFGDNFVKQGQYTPYLKKFNVANGKENIGHKQYMTNVSGALQEGNNIRKAFTKNWDASITFEIPLFSTMKIPNNPSSNLDNIISGSGKPGKQEGSVNPPSKNESEKNIEYRIDTGNRSVVEGKGIGFLVIPKEKKGLPKYRVSNSEVGEIKLVNPNDSRGYYFEVYGRKVGETTVEVEYGGTKKSFILTVKEKENSYRIDTGNRTVQEGKGIGFLVIPKEKKGLPKYRVSNSEVGEIKLVNPNDSRGYYFEVYGRQAGETTIEVEYGGFKKSFILTVNPGENSYRIDTGNRVVEEGRGIGFLAIPKEKRGLPKYRVSNSKVGEIKLVNPNDSRGYYFEVYGRQVGETTVEVEYQGVIRRFNLVVRQGENSYRVDTGNRIVEKGKGIGFLAIPKEKKGLPKYRVSNKDVGEVKLVNANDPRGYYFEVYGKNAGTTTVEVEYSGIIRNFVLTVK